MRLRLCLVVLTLLAVGCAHDRARLDRQALPPGAPKVETILADLAANDAALTSFTARGKFTLKSPDLETTYLLPSSDVSFVRPDELYVIGRKHAHTVLRLRCKGAEFLAELPTERKFSYRPEGARVDELNLDISPADIAREMFLPEDWATLDPRKVGMASYDPATQTAELLILDERGRHPRRMVTVQGVPWVVTGSELFGKKGDTIARTTLEDYRTEGQLRFPAKVATDFPGRDARMSFEAGSFTLNVPIADMPKDLADRARALQAEGYEAVEPARKKP